MVYSLENGYTKGELKVIDYCCTLASSQGFYGRLLNELENNRELLRELGKQDFKDILDFVIYMEC